MLQCLLNCQREVKEAEEVNKRATQDKHIWRGFYFRQDRKTDLLERNMNEMKITTIATFFKMLCVFSAPYYED